jgi:hypothetical protein
MQKSVPREVWNLLGLAVAGTSPTNRRDLATFFLVDEERFVADTLFR